VTTAVFLALAFVAWRRYLRAADEALRGPADTCPHSLTDVFGERHLVNVPHQQGIRWLSEVFGRSAGKYPDLTALQIPHTGESLTFAELDARARSLAAHLSPYLTGPDQVVAVAMPQDNWQIVAAHLGILKAGGTLMFVDTTLPDALINHMLDDARPVVVLTRGQDSYRGLPTIDVLTLPENGPPLEPPPWLDDPAQRLAAIFYTSGTTGMPKGVECPHAGYVNLALSYADYFDLVAGIDATSLTSSLGYDGSISEMYSAWVSGCAVVMLTKEQVRSGPDLLPVLREAEVTVLFCPPVLLTTLTQTPELDLPYPLCRYIVPAGEAFPSALVEPWTRGRRQVINTYGPAEASTDTSRQSLRPGEPVTIGSPLANVTYVILEVDGLGPLPHGEVGELCIGGVHVARGYRNLPELTARKFITHPRFGRLYRTGDRCRIDPRTQRVHFLGRIDAQLKVRGHRVEAQAVEDLLQARFSEIEAAVVDYRNESLVAFVAAPSVREAAATGVAAAPAAWAGRVLATLARQLPSPSVPSRIFLVDQFVLQPVSGKIDRKRLPDLSGLLRDAEPQGRGAPTAGAADPAAGEARPASADADPRCAEVLAICRSVFGTRLGLDDAFADAGGHSIAIARLAHHLQVAGWAVPVRALLSDCNTARKVAASPPMLQPEVEATAAPAAKSDEHRTERDEAAAEVLSVRHFTTLQVLFAVLLYSPAFVAALGVFDVAEVGTFFTTASLVDFIVLGLVLYGVALVTPFASLLWVMTIKRLIGGSAWRNDVTPGVYPKWSRMHLRVWCIARLQTSVLFPLGAVYRSAPLMAFFLRQLGATVGRNLQCAHDAQLAGPLDLMSFGDDVAIQTGAYVQSTGWHGSNLHVGPVRLGSGCKIGMRAVVAGGVTVGNGSWITPFSPILADVGANEMWEGAPARLVGRCTELRRTAQRCRYAWPIGWLETLNVLMGIGIFFCLSVVPAAAISWFARDLIPATEAGSPGAYFQATPLAEIVWQLALYAFVTTWVTVVVTSVLGCLFIRFTAASPGIYPSHGLRGALLMHRMNLMNAIQRRWTWTLTGQYLRALAGVHFGRVGGSECDVMFNLVPELASADPQVFWSSECFTNMLDQSAQHFLLRPLDMPRNFFCGNNGVAEYGHFPSNFLLGVSSPANHIGFRRQMRSRLGEPITVLGNPPLKVASATFDADDEAHRPPGFALFLTRVCLNDLFGIGILRIAEGLVSTILCIGLLRAGVHPIAGVLLALVLTEAALLVLCVAIKQLLVGSRWGADDSTPFWSWRHFAYFFAQDCFLVWCRVSLAFCAGTVLANPVLRAMGCRIGERTLVTQPMQCMDWNAVSVGQDVVIDGLLQLHTLENMMLKVKRTRIDDGCTVGLCATVMGGAALGPQTTLLPLSLVGKEMALSTATYEGSPAQVVGGPGPDAAPRPAARLTSAPRAVDNTDWLKATAIVFVVVAHFGHFFIEDDSWWSVFGRLAAPMFFFLMGYAKSRTVPAHWIGVGIVLTLLDSSNNDWTWVAPNILLSFVLIRIASRHAERFVRRYGWVGCVVLLGALVAMLPVAAPIVDYGAEGWLWALFGLCQRLHVDGVADGGRSSSAPALATPGGTGPTRLLACLVAAVVYIWQEQLEFAFSETQLAVVVLCVGVMALVLCLFRRGPSRIQPAENIAGVLRFIGRHTLAIYAIQLAASELIVKFLSDLPGSIDTDEPE
jgi:non-ribosomal peptide synthetase-like protein